VSEFARKYPSDEAKETDRDHADRGSARVCSLVCSCHRNLIFFGAIERPAETLAAWTAYFSVILIHEFGHMIAARRKGYHVTAIELYPIHGCVCFQQGWSRYDDAVIAWGRVVAQAVVAVPLVTFVAIFGFTRSDVVNVAIGILGYYSLIVRGSI
jgi:hypothetical protein